MHFSSLPVHSGDTDAVVPVTATRYSIDALKLPTLVNWYPWYVMYGRTYARTRRARDVRRAAAREATGGAEQADGQQAHDQISG